MVHARRVIVNAIVYVKTGPGAPGGTCPTTSRPGAPSTATSRAGATTAPATAARRVTRPGPGRCRPRPPPDRGRDRLPVGAGSGHRALGQPGWDNAEKDGGRKRHIAVDATGLVLAAVIIAASVQDRDAARTLLWNLPRCCARVRLAWAEAEYAGKLASWAASLKIQLEIVRKRDAHAFEVLLPRRWVVERTLYLDHRAPPLRPRLRTVARRPRGHGPAGHGRPDNPAPRHPEAVTTKSSTHLDVS